MNHLRHTPRLVADSVAYVMRSGRWWVPVLVLLLAVVAGIASATATVVPVSVYVIF